jgi:hypothetical protein
MRVNLDRLLALGVALAASALLLVLPTIERKAPPAPPTTAAVAWPHAQSATVPAVLPDGTPYQPGVFLDARTSVGSAPSPDHRYLRLVLRSGTGAAKELRRVPQVQHVSFRAFTRDGDVLAWMEQSDGGRLQVWTVNLRDGTPARELTADTGTAVFVSSQYDLLVAGGRVHWTASPPGQRGVTEVRSVALDGGPVDVRTEPGTWRLSAWPWLVDGDTEQVSTTRAKNLSTGRTIPVAGTARQTIDCSPSWCQVITLTSQGYNIALRHPDGTAQVPVAVGKTLPAVVDVAALNRFALLAGIGPYSDLTGTTQLLAFDLATRRTIEVSPAARTVGYNGGVLWWSTGTQDSPVWHTIDLRTVDAQSAA